MDLPSDSDESDVDFVPAEEFSNSDAESETDADKETEEQYENELVTKNKKRAAKSSKKKPRKKAKLDDEEKPDKNKVDTEKLDPGQAKKYEDDLWASFLDMPSQSSQTVTVEKPKATAKKVIESPPEQSSKSKETVEDRKEKTVVVEEVKISSDKDKNSCKIGEQNTSANTNSPAALNKGRIPLPSTLPFNKKPAGGLASLIGQLGKKSKLTTLEKSKLDWTNFKKDEGINEEIQTHNRGKSGFLERQDFLERTDLRQYEIEKNLRLKKRSSR